MNKSTKIILSVLGGFSALIDLMTPLAVAIVWIYYFDFSEFISKFIIMVGGFASIFRAIKIGFIKK